MIPIRPTHKEIKRYRNLRTDGITRKALPLEQRQRVNPPLEVPWFLYLCEKWRVNLWSLYAYAVISWAPTKVIVTTSVDFVGDPAIPRYASFLFLSFLCTASSKNSHHEAAKKSKKEKDWQSITVARKQRSLSRSLPWPSYWDASQSSTVSRTSSPT